jgi:hypothetical protein
MENHRFLALREMYYPEKNLETLNIHQNYIIVKKNKLKI